MDWTKISSDPTDTVAVKKVIEYLNSIRKKIKDNDYLSFLVDKVSGKTVLDIGVVEHTITRIETEGWKHKIICSHAKSCVGIDILEKETKYLNEKGFNIKVVDATSDTDLGSKFDVVHVGDVIEHIDKPAQLLAFCRRHLSDDGIVIVKTPNPFCFNYFLRMFKNKTDQSNLEHVCWITPSQALELGRRNGLLLTNYYTIKKTGITLGGKRGIKDIIRHFKKGRIIHIIMQIFAPDEILSATYVYEYKKNPQ